MKDAVRRLRDAARGRPEAANVAVAAGDVAAALSRVEADTKVAAALRKGVAGLGDEQSVYVSAGALGHLLNLLPGA